MTFDPSKPADDTKINQAHAFIRANFQAIKDWLTNQTPLEIEWASTGYIDPVTDMITNVRGSIFTAGYKGVEEFDGNGNLVWTFTGHGNTARALAADGAGNVYSGGGDNTVRQLNSSGIEQWVFNGHTGTILAMVYDLNNQCLYTASADHTVKRLNFAGTEFWTFTEHTDAVLAIAVDSLGNVYSGGGDNTVKKIDVNGNLVWNFTEHTGTVRAIVVDSDDFIYTAGDYGNVKKLDSNGTEISTFTVPHGGNIGSKQNLAVDKDGYFYLTDDDRLIKLTPTWEIIWSIRRVVNWTVKFGIIALDELGVLYAVYPRDTIRKFYSVVTGFKP